MDATDDLHVVATEIRMLAGLIAKMAMADLGARLSRAGLNLSGLQFHVLRTLGRRPYTLSDLSRQFSLEPATLVPVVDALEKRGYVVRSKDPNDRRRNQLVITQAGLDALARALASEVDATDPMMETLQRLGEDRVRLLQTLLRELADGIANDPATVPMVIAGAREQSEAHRAVHPVGASN